MESGCEILFTDSEVRDRLVQGIDLGLVPKKDYINSDHTIDISAT